MKQTKESCKNSCTYKGFTLIEFLVVVVIIGILASIALSQYKFSMEKTKISKYLSIGQSIRNAQEVFYMTHGKYATDLTSLDIDITQLCDTIMSAKNLLYNCPDKSIQIDNMMGDAVAYGYLRIIYCSSLSNKTQTSYLDCQRNKDCEIIFPYSLQNRIKTKKAYCGEIKTNKGKRLCKALGL